MLSAKELRRWRDSLLAGRQASSVTRVCKSLKAALNLAAAVDPAITNSAAWRVGLAGLPDTPTARHVGLPEQDVRALVAAARTIDPAFGLWTEVAATTGARPSQISRLEVADLQADRVDPRVMTPSSKKGRGRKRIERRPVPIPTSLAAKLQRAAAGRSANAPLLLRADGKRWGERNHSDHVKPFAQAAARAALDGVTAYSLRHSNIIRGLLAGTPARLVAIAHDTSVLMLERNYSPYILDHSDEISARGCSTCRQRRPTT